MVIAETEGHWQAMGIHKGKPYYLKNDGTFVWPGGSHNGKVPYRYWNLREAMDEFIKYYPKAVGTK